MVNSPYLDQPLFPLAVALPRMLAKIESELPSSRLEVKRELEGRARLICELLALPPVT